jgi:tRNA (adenine57-N1/adenine58-N1)-methyltransferase
VNTPQLNDLVLLLSPDEKRYLIRLMPNGRIDTNRGYILHNDMVGKEFGTHVKTHMKHNFMLLRPSTSDLVMHTKRISQIIYPKEIGYIILKLNVIPGARIVEAGTGSGGLTMAMARAVAPNGCIYTYEARDDMQANARKNLERTGVLANVEMKLRDIREGFDERDADSLFLDVREPWMFLAQAHAALKSGGFFGSLVPTTNQLSDLLQEMENLGGWADIEVLEILARYYKPVPDRLRPQDRMIAHTGFLLFARAVQKNKIEPETKAETETEMETETLEETPNEGE